MAAKTKNQNQKPNTGAELNLQRAVTVTWLSGSGSGSGSSSVSVSGSTFLPIGAMCAGHKFHSNQRLLHLLSLTLCGSNSGENYENREMQKQKCLALVNEQTSRL